MHIHGSRSDRSRKRKSLRQYPLFIRRLAGMFSSGWRSIQSTVFSTKLQAFASNTSRFKRNSKARADVGDWSAKLLVVGTSLLYVAFYALYIYWFVIFFGDLSFFASLVDINTWSFGQIVAITVWAQPLCEYFHLELRKSYPKHGKGLQSSFPDIQRLRNTMFSSSC